jgi:hypothetical protein
VEEAREGIETLFNHYNRMSWEMLLPPGYSSVASMTALVKLRASAGVNTGYQTIERLIANGTVMVGTAKTVSERIARMREQTGLRNIVAMLQFGKLPNHLAERNMQRFAADIIPQFRD